MTGPRRVLLIGAFAAAACAAEPETWTVTNERSRLDDTVNVVATLPARRSIYDGRDDRHRFSLTVACREGVTDAWIDFDGITMSNAGDLGFVFYRLDGAPALRRRFVATRENGRLGLWGEPWSIGWIKQLLGTRQLYIRAYPSRERPAEAEFEIAGIDAAMEPIRSACQW